MFCLVAKRIITITLRVTFRLPEILFLSNLEYNQAIFIVVKLQNTNALARLAVLVILSAARRLLFF
ncbi:MAG: hypothetical protein J5680_01935 [Neisseriaceae bacterium]|nr:hypothetical protein [Neisseriaceae bacterium]